MLIILPMFMACGSDDSKGEPDTFNVSDAYGSWMCVKSTDKYQGQSVDGLLVGKTITIYDNGTFTSDASSMGRKGTYTINGNVITAKSSEGTFVVNVKLNSKEMEWEGTASNGVSFTYVFQKMGFDTYSARYPVFVTFSTSSYAELSSAMSRGCFITLRPRTTDQGPKVEISNGVSTQAYTFSAIDYRSFRFGLGGLIVGTNNNGISLAYDLACPNCDRTEYRLTISTSGTATCAHCHIAYDLNDYGSIANDDNNTIHDYPRELYKYHAEINSATFHVYN